MTDQQWFPRPKPAAPRQEIRVQRDDDHPVLGRRPRHEGARIVAEQGDVVLVHWQHRAPTAHAVAVQINGWWYPVPHDGLSGTGGRRLVFRRPMGAFGVVCYGGLCRTSCARSATMVDTGIERAINLLRSYRRRVRTSYPITSALSNLCPARDTAD